MTELEEICSVSFADTESATELLRDFTNQEGGIVKVDWYALRSKIADKISMTRVEERDILRKALEKEEKSMADYQKGYLDGVAREQKKLWDLEKYVSYVLIYDWCYNDPDAVAAMDKLREHFEGK